MFGPRLNTVFASRWKALWWSSMVLVTAYCTVPAADEPGKDNTVAARKQEEQAAKLVRRPTGGSHGSTKPPRNAWALDPKK